MTKIAIKVSNDHCNFSEQFEADEILLSTGASDPHLKSMVDKCIVAFNQPVDEVRIKTTMEV